MNEVSQSHPTIDEMAATYLVEIQDEIEKGEAYYSAEDQIAASVYEAENKAHDVGGPVAVLLDHAESPVAINGRSQKPPRRPDGGYTWYHNNTACYMVAWPQDRSSFSREHSTMQREWADHVQDILVSSGYPEHHLQYGNHDDRYGEWDPDIYIKEHPIDEEYGAQIVGLSLQNRGETRIERACWYEDDPFEPAFNALLEQDGIDPDDFAANISIADSSILDYLTANLSPEEPPADEFLSENSLMKAQELQDGKHGNINASCVLGKHYGTQ